MQRTFENGSGFDRPILIEIENNTISFYFKKDYDRHWDWLKDAEENDEEIEKDMKEPQEFYYIPKERWNNPNDHYPQHMMNKNWFTQEMLDYINTNL